MPQVGGSNSLLSGPGDSPHDIWSMVHWPCSRDPQIKHSGEKNERGKNEKTGLVGCGGDYFGDVERASSHEVIHNQTRLTIKQRALKEYLLVKILRFLY